MAKHWRYFLFLLWFSYLIVSSILLFTSGFLLNRQVLNRTSTCVHQSDLACDTKCSLNYALKNGAQVCQPAKARIVLLIIDALRYDFVLFDENLHSPLPYQNKMPVISDVLNSQPEKSKLYKFIADPPTTTMQRLKALTTGSLPTFIDAGSNFATSEIGEDNIIDQLRSENKTTVFLGDDTWEGLYPGRFFRSYPFPSFNVWDLDTVDFGVTENIFHELKKSDWSLLVAHYLGVDHCGHRYGPNHKEMARKLYEMNEVLRNVINELPQDAMLFVVGDHGMTGTGDHGGESLNEITSAMFVYSNLLLYDNDKGKDSAVKQVDLIPTLAAILGIPIPFANLGSVILNCLPVSDWQEIQLIVWVNLQQVFTYVTEYSNVADIFDAEWINNLKQQFKSLIMKTSDSKEFLSDAFDLMSEVHKNCEQVWVQFDSFSMLRGLIFVFLTLFLVYTIVDGIPSKNLSGIFNASYVQYLYVSLAAAIALNCALYCLNFVPNFITNLFFVSGLISIFILAVPVVLNWDLISMSWYEAGKRRDWTEILSRLILLISLCGFFSNSFIIEEAYVTLFLLMSLIVIIVFDLFFATKNSKFIIKKSIKTKLLILSAVFCVLIRLSVYFWQCREEHNCDVQSRSFNRIEWVLALVSLSLLVTLTRMCLRSCGNLSGFSATIILAQFTPVTIVVCCLGFWILHNLSTTNIKSKFSFSWQPLLLAWVVYFLIILGLVSIYIKPLSLYVLPKKRNPTNSIPQLFKQVKSLLDRGNEGDMPVVYGLGTVYSAAFFIAGIYVVLLFALLLGHSFASAAVLMYFAAMTVSIITSIARYEKSNSIGQLLNMPTTSLLLWVMLSRYFFYGTGHQPTFPNIAWEAAFVGTGGEFSHNFIPAMLVIVNTFGSYILIGFMLPFFQIVPFSLYVMVKSLTGKKIEAAKDVSRGDVLLYENDSQMFDNVFILCCKYLCCQFIHVLASMLSATIHCRHLMVWKIFAPKFIFEAIAAFISIPSVLLGYLLLLRINREVDKFVKRLNKVR